MSQQAMKIAGSNASSLKNNLNDPLPPIQGAQASLSKISVAKNSSLYSEKHNASLSAGPSPGKKRYKVLKTLMGSALGPAIIHQSGNVNKNSHHINATSIPTSAFDKTHSVWNQKMQDFQNQDHLKVRPEPRILASRIYNRKQDPSLPIPGSVEEDFVFTGNNVKSFFKRRDDEEKNQFLFPGHSKTRSFFQLANNTLIGRQSFYGPRYDKKGNVIPRSIAGNPQSFQRVKNYQTFQMGKTTNQDMISQDSPGGGSSPMIPRLSVKNRQLKTSNAGYESSMNRGSGLQNYPRIATSSLSNIEATNKNLVAKTTQSTARSGANPNNFQSARSNTLNKRSSQNRTIPLTQENFSRLVAEIKSRTLRPTRQISPIEMRATSQFPVSQRINLQNDSISGNLNNISQGKGFMSMRAPSLTGQKIKAGKDLRAMENYQRITKFWNFQNSKLQEKVKRENTNDSILFKSQEYREKLQNLEAMQKASPCEVTYGRNMWYMSLRNSGQDGDGSRVIPMGGNPMSGLFLRIKQVSNQETDVIKRPKRESRSLINFFKNPYLKKKMQSEKVKISKIKPGKDEAVDLEVVGESKLVKELEYCTSIQNEKYLYLDHVVNDEGEGEPDFEEQMIESHQDRIAKY